MELKLRRSARWLQGYACAPVCIRPSSIKNIPCWYVRDPLTTYPAPDADPDTLTPEDVIFAFKKSIAWIDYNVPLNNIKRRKSNPATGLSPWSNICPRNRSHGLALSSDINPDFSTVEPVNYGTTLDDSWLGTEKIVTLEHAINIAGVCPAVIPGRVTLDREQGQYDGIIGMYRSAAMLFALNFHAVAQDVWPNEWLISHPGRQGKIVKMANGRIGEIGEVVDGEIRPQHLNPGYKADQLISQLERNQRVTAGIP